MAESRKNKKAAMESGVDFVSDLPDGVLEYILSFLSSREAVRTCVLSRRWRHLWRSVPALRVTRESIKNSEEFLDHVLLGRRRAPIYICDFQLVDYYDFDMPHLNMWVFYAVSLCRVQELRVCVEFVDDLFHLADLPFFSKYLTRLELDSVTLKAWTVDFSSCPALEDIELIFCNIDTKEITSKSLKRLSMTTCRFDDEGTRTRFSVPSLVSLELIDFTGWTPLLGSMPSLEKAVVTFDDSCLDFCDYTDFWDCGEEDCFGCYGIDDDSDNCLLLEVLSGATHLELRNEPKMFVFERDLEWCPTFCNLKALLLNGWFVAPDLYGLVCILQHSPVLQQLTLQLHMGPEQMVETEGSYDPMEQSCVMKYLNEVKVKCQKVDEWIYRILKTLSTFGMPLEQIEIQETGMSS